MKEEEIRAVLSRNLKNLREKNGLSQMALAEKSSLATNFINDIENGKKWLSPATLSKLSEALGVQPYKLFLEIEFDHENQNGFMSQFCTELSNDILGTIKAVYARYEERA